MKQVISLFLLLVVLLLFTDCTNRAIQEAYWGAGTSVALDEEKKGNIQGAETELKVALSRANKELDDEKRAASLHNIGAFYRRQERLSDAIYYLNEALKLEEKVSGPASERTGRTLAELAVVYLIEGNLFDGRVFADRLKPLSTYYSGNEALFVEKIFEAYKIDFNKYNSDVARLKPEADAGVPKAQYELATVYFDGPDAKKLLPEIVSLFEKSADQGFVESKYYLGVMYDKGRGVSKDDIKAREWYRIAAERGHAIGQYNYAVFLIQGRGGTKNENEAWMWFKKSSEQGNTSAQRALSRYKQ
jgi:hypothetical protein